MQSTHYGGAGSDQINAMVINIPTNEVLTAGYTDSVSLPAIVGGALKTNAGVTDVFAARLSASFTGPVRQSTFFGGNNVDVASAIAIHPFTGDVYIAGSTLSPSLPGSAGAAQPAFAGGDAFIARFNTTLTAGSLRSTFFGGSASEFGIALVIHPVTGEVLARSAPLRRARPGPRFSRS